MTRRTRGGKNRIGVTRGVNDRIHQLQNEIRQPCPTPTKLSFRKVERAIAEAVVIYQRQASHDDDPPQMLYVYRCVCGRFHHTRQDPKTRARR